ncbi:MAG: histidine--tRNA ligase [Polyangiaceae bacterium]
MASSSKIVPPRGMRDILPEEFFLRERLISVIRDVYESHGYAGIDTPVPERIEYLTAKAGGETEQLMFKIMKRAQEGGDEGGAPTELADMGLRYDLTVSLCRYYATNHAHLPAIFRRYHIAPVWRADRPQRGRLREFYQCDVDVIGIKDSLPECEVILATTHALRRLDVGETFVRISDRRLLPIVLTSMGFDDAQSRKAMVSIDKLDKIGVEGVAKEGEAHFPAELAGKFAAFVKDIASVGRGADIASDVLGEWGQKCNDALAPVLDNLRHIKQVVTEASAAPVALDFSPSLVRGMAYYTGPVFEIGSAAESFSLAGGGRYDGLVGQFLGKEVPAAGFSIGFERIYTLLKERKKEELRRTRAIALFAPRAAGIEARSLRDAHSLREAGIKTELHPFTNDIKKQFKHAEEMKIRWIVLQSADGAIELIDSKDRSRTKGDLAHAISRIQEAEKA